MILLIINFREVTGYRHTSPVQGTYGLLTEDPIILDFHNKNLKHMPLNDPLYFKMNEFFFSEYNNSRFPSYKRLNKCFKLITEVLPNSEMKSDITNIVTCEVG